MSSASETELEWLQDPETIRGLQGIPPIQTPLRIREEAPFFQEQIQRAIIQKKSNKHSSQQNSLNTKIFSMPRLAPLGYFFVKYSMQSTIYFSVKKKKKKNLFSILFWFVGFCCHFFLKRCFLTFASPSLFNVIFHLNCLLIVRAALAEHD